jgi:hypothetical protein
MSQKTEQTMTRKKSEFVSAMGTGFEIVQALSGAVTDLGGSDDDLRKVLSDKKLRVKMAQLLVGTSATMTLAQMIADAGFPSGRFSTDIHEQNFPLDKEGAYDASGLYLIGGDREWTINEVESAVKPGGGRLEGLVRGLAWLKANSEALKDGDPIVFPASSWVDADGDVLVPCARLDDGEPWLGLDWGGRDGRWNRPFRFLVSGK